MYNLEEMKDSELIKLKSKIESEIVSRASNPKKFIKVIHIDDGCEGLYIKLENFMKIPSDELHDLLNDILTDNISFEPLTMSEMAEDVYEQECSQYEWIFEPRGHVNGND